ncbi:antitoxin VapB family protein [Pseudomonas sp. LS1212]|uniref:antitoxin VapB family protein n=1 Tax=Pseudomonas sp. LS1212 TaxID=2972478 RepID=UPI00215CC3F4|nr:antitoxin VapB family protein [Pseudomonas sp. LS1212]UVJ42852.1 antitoxin VapB family protein [Pseudomonas sp. LS1212]
MKATKMIHPSHAREILSEVDAARLRQSGWLELDQTKPVSKGAAFQRRYRKRQLMLGFKQFSVWLPESVFNALAAMKKPKESFAELVERLINSPNNTGEYDSGEHTK